MNKDENYIDFDSIRNSITFDNINFFSLYLNDIFIHLTNRLSAPSHYLSKPIFHEYFGIRHFIAEKLYNAMNQSQTPSLSKADFTSKMISLYQGDFDETIKIIFSIFDFDKDGSISKEDVKLLLSYLPLKSTGYEEQMKSLKELDEIINVTFSNKTTLTVGEYKNAIVHIKSDSYLQLLLYLYNNKPFTISTVNAYKYTKKKVNQKGKSISPNKTRLKSPSKHTAFASTEKFLINICAINNTEDNDKNTKTVKLINSPSKEGNKEKSLSPSKIRRNNNNELRTTSTFFKKGSMKAEENSSNWIYQYEDNNKTLFKKYYSVLSGKDILFYTSSMKNELCSILPLGGVFITKEQKSVLINKVEYHVLNITFSNHVQKKLYFTTSSYRDEWFTKTKKANNNLDFVDYYTISTEIGKGHFGTVAKATNKSTKQEVAVKKIMKKKLEPRDFELIQREICVMKLVNHPNLVHLIDYYEDDECIYIVMDLLEGGDLISYLNAKGKLTERVAAKIIKQIALGIQYMNCYGLIHRDLKPENICFAKQNDIHSLKIIDYGLTITLAYGEAANETIGTINYIAPEVFSGKAYNNKVDIWSIGVILYLMLSGLLPFDDEDDNNIGKMVMLGVQTYPNEQFGSRSKAVIELIDKCLEKNPSKRVDIDSLINDDWIVREVK